MALPLLEESRSRLSTIGLERSKFLTKTGIGQQEESGVMQGILETELINKQQTQELLERKRAAESERKFKEQQLALQKKQIKQQEQQANAAMWSGIPVVGPLIGGLSFLALAIGIFNTIIASI